MVDYWNSRKMKAFLQANINIPYERFLRSLKVAYHLLYRLTPPYENLYQDSGPTADSSYTSQAYNLYLCENFSQ